MVVHTPCVHVCPVICWIIGSQRVRDGMSVMWWVEVYQADAPLWFRPRSRERTKLREFQPLDNVRGRRDGVVAYERPSANTSPGKRVVGLSNFTIGAFPTTRDNEHSYPTPGQHTAGLVNSQHHPLELLTKEKQSTPHQGKLRTKACSPSCGNENVCVNTFDASGWVDVYTSE